MQADFWRWLIDTDQGLASRIAAGVIVFIALAVWDIRRKGRSAQRWREYLFLFTVVVAALAYGVINDQITSTISWEYFYAHDENIAAALGSVLPPPEKVLRWEAFKLGLKATWTGGLLLGVAFLIANNPSKRFPQLPYRTLYRLLLLPLIVAVSAAVVLGLAGWFGLIARILDLNLGEAIRPHRYWCVYGIHLGGYVGSTAGLIAGVWQILRLRRKAPAGPTGVTAG